VHFHKRHNSLVNKILSLSGGIILFLVALPILFIWIASFVKNIFSFDLPVIIEYLLSIIILGLGLFLLIWASYFQWKIGIGTAAPNAPTQHLVVSGPYRLCRNPIELGAIFYYFGIGTLYGGVVIGVVGFILGFVIGSLYHKYIEEKELEIRFGDEYKEYKKFTPFLFPKIQNLLDGKIFKNNFTKGK
jgi:protein-S-isoprenylcysteine O-methyltransferase Ste14